ncbi:hypothetical protein M5689_000161 [Euphorbia peplus]|nr:hypothetical protein M5689_000161 [Euphorbia peplus]
MGRNQHSITLFYTSLLMGFLIFSGAGARQLRGGGGSVLIGDVGKELEDVKRSGPSPGIGHVYTTSVLDHSGPSPGEGHKYVNSGNNP